MRPKLLVIIIFFLAFFLRFTSLGSFPAGLTWDEAAIGYNAYGILTVHRDEWLSRMPLAFRSFGDYKSPLNIYLTVPSVALFGLNTYAVRFPVALAGLLLVPAGYFLSLEIFAKEKRKEEISLFVMLLLAVSPWALHFSRIAFESMIATSLAAWGALFLLMGLKKTKYLPISGLLFSLSLYAYHSAKVVVPLTILLILYTHRSKLRTQLKPLALFFITCLLVSLPLLYLSFFGKASDRFFGSSFIFTADKHLKPLTEIIPTFASHYLIHLSPAYLLSGFEQNFRQSNGLDGILSPIEFFLGLTAIVCFIFVRSSRRYLFLLIIFLISIIPATLGNDVPHANRALMGLPWVQLLAGVGFSYLLHLKRPAIITALLLVLMSLGLICHIASDFRVYRTAIALADLQYGYEDTIMYARSMESQVKRIYITNHYGQAYIYLLFYKKMNPIDYRGGGLGNYVITDHPFEDARGQSNVLIIGTPDEIPGYLGREKEFKYPDGKVAFRVVRQ